MIGTQTLDRLLGLSPINQGGHRSQGLEYIRKMKNFMREVSLMFYETERSLIK
jgi:hypothetical protein